MSRKIVVAIWCGLIAVRVALGLSFIRANSATGDEPLYIAAGYIALHAGDFSVNSGHPPLTKLLAGAAASAVWAPPYAHDPDWRGGAYRPFDEFFYADRVYATLGERAELVTMVARVPGMLLGLVLCGVCGVWAHRRWGAPAGILALALTALDPNLIAHSCVVGTDGPLACFLVLAIYLAWEYAQRPSRRLLVGIGLGFGLALATKFSAAVVSPVIAVLVFHAGRVALGRRGWRWIGGAVGAGAVVVAIALAVLLASYGSTGLHEWRIGMGSQLAHQSSGHPAFLRGELSRDGWWYYFPVAVFAKTPAVTLVVVIAGLAWWHRRPGRRWLDTWALLLPAAVFFAFNVVLSVNPGVRYVLAVYPFLFVAAGSLACAVPARARAAAVAGAIAAVAATTLPAAPHQLAYFSHFIGGPDRGDRWLSDSNIDWGQDLGGLSAWLNERGGAAYLAYYGRFPPSYLGTRFQYAPGFTRPPTEQRDSWLVEPAPRYLAVSVTNLHGTYTGNPALYAWLAPYAPVAKIGYSIFVYDLHAIPDAHRHLAEAYTAIGDEGFARAELARAAPGSAAPHR